MKPKEVRRAHLMELLAAGKLTVSGAARLMGLNKQQVKRRKKEVSAKKSFSCPQKPGKKI